MWLFQFAQEICPHGEQESGSHYRVESTEVVRTLFYPLKSQDDITLEK